MDKRIGILHLLSFGCYDYNWHKILIGAAPLNVADFAIKIGEVLEVSDIRYLRDYMVVSLTEGDDAVRQLKINILNNILTPEKVSRRDKDPEDPFVLIHDCIGFAIRAWNAFLLKEDQCMELAALTLITCKKIVDKYSTNSNVEKLFKDFLAEYAR